MTSGTDVPSPVDPQLLGQPRESDTPHSTKAELRRRIDGIRELPDGYALLLRGDKRPILTVLELFRIERLAFHFLRIELAVEPVNGEFWVHFTGSNGVKQFLQDELLGASSDHFLLADSSPEWTHK